MTAKEKNFTYQLLVEVAKIIFPTLHIKLRLMKDFGKVFNVEDESFKFICITFPGLNHDNMNYEINKTPNILELGD